MENRIRDLRIDYNYYQKDIANLLNVTQQQYSKIELNKSQLDYNGLITLAKFYNTSIDYILGLTDIRKPYPRSKWFKICDYTYK